MLRRPFAVATALAAALAVASCASPAGSQSPGPTASPFAYFTHCGVGQVWIDGVTYYPTGVYDGDTLITWTDPDWYASGAGPTPWITIADNTVQYTEGVADLNQTYGTIEMFADGTAVFRVNGGQYSVRLSDDEDDAQWIIEGCF